MNRADPFFILILILFSVLTITYKTAQYDFSGLQFQLQVNQQLKNKIKRLELKQKEYEISQLETTQTKISNPAHRSNRQIASLPPEQKNEVYVEPEVQAQQMYKDAFKQCQKVTIEPSCLTQIESIITLFPETKWAGESLVLLTHIYIQSKKRTEVVQLIRIVKNDFKKYSDVQNKINQIEKSIN